jgi:DNA mismatch repair protein MutS
MDRVKNYNVAIKEWNDQIIFLRKVIEGGADKSYGIQVARLAGLPKEVIARAREVLANLEKAEFDDIGEPIPASKSGRGDAETGRRGEKADKGTGGQGEPGKDRRGDAETRGRGDDSREIQLRLFATRDANLVREIAELDLNSITPLDAMNKLSELKK